jgi:hypothetical protein
MTIFRSRAAAILGVLAIGSGAKALPPAADDCPKQDLGFDLQQYEVLHPEMLPKCLTEQAVKLSEAGGTADEVSIAVVSACGAAMGMYESLAGVRRFEQGDTDAVANGQSEVRKAAQRYALTRVVQVRAGECSRR